jgi:elongation factor G
MPRGFSAVRTRNIGVVAHVDAGKTTCTERILFYTGLVHRPGEVHTGTTTTDFTDEERRRGITISAASVTTRWEPQAGTAAGVAHEIRIIDTPGHIDFAIEVERSLRVLDGAIVLLDASQGVECQTEAVWRQAERHSVPRVTFVNKMDHVAADFACCLREMHERLGARPVAAQMPIGAGEAFRGVVDLVRMRALSFEGDMGRAVVAGEVPAGLLEEARAARRALVEACADVDDAVLDDWAAGRDPSADAIERALRTGTLSGRLHPVLCGSAYRYKGVQPLLDAVVSLLPSPEDRPGAIGRDPSTGADLRCAPDAGEPLAALAFKAVRDRNGVLTFLRIYSGRLQRGDAVLVPSRGARERVGRLYVVHAAEREEVAEARAGDIVAAFGLRSAKTGDTLCAPERPVVLETIAVPEPVVEVALEPRTSEDRDRLGEALACLLTEDPSLRVRIDEDSGQTILRAMGQLHVEIATSRLSGDGVRVRVGKPEVAYRDTLRTGARVEHRHVKQSGGPGQFACVVLEVEPGAPGSGVAFEDATIGGAVPQAFVPAVEKGVRAACARGIRRGHPIVDVVVRLVNGASHVKDSSAPAFELAAASATREAAAKSGLVLLEPIMAVEVTVPEAQLGEAIGDLISRRGNVHKVTPRAGGAIVDAAVPLASLFGYVSDLRGMTHGRGQAVIRPEAYAPASDAVAARLLRG